MNKKILVILTLVLLVPAVTSTEVEYEDEQIILLEGDVDLTFYEATAWGGSSDLSVGKLAYDNETNTTFYIITSTNVSDKIVPGMFNGTITYTYRNANNPTDTYTFEVDYSVLEVPLDPLIIEYQNQIEEYESEIVSLNETITNLTADIEEYESYNIEGMQQDIAQKDQRIGDLEAQLDECTDKQKEIAALKLNETSFEATIDSYESNYKELENTVDQLKDPFVFSYEEPGKYGYKENHLYFNYTSMIIGVVACFIFFVLFVNKFKPIRDIFEKVAGTAMSKAKKVKNTHRGRIFNMEQEYLNKQKEESE